MAGLPKENNEVATTSATTARRVDMTDDSRTPGDAAPYHIPERYLIGKVKAPARFVPDGRFLYRSRLVGSEQPFDLPVLEPDVLGARHLGQARHGHDLAADRDDEPRACGQPHLAHRHRVVGRRAELRRVGGKRVL